jgi:hypothetical protein
MADFENLPSPVLSLPGLSRQSMNTDSATSAPAVIMGARNKCGHDREGKMVTCDTAPARP